MPADNTGRQSVGLISAQQLRGVKDEDLLKDILPDPSTFGHANNKIDTDMQPIVDMLVKQKPAPPPTYANLRARADRERYDTIGHLKPDPPKTGRELDVNDWLKHSVLSVRATGGTLRYPPRREAYEPEAPNPFANSIFVAQPQSYHEHRPSKPAEPLDLDLNGWIRRSIFYDDPQLKSAVRRREEQEEQELRERLRRNEEERVHMRGLRAEEGRRRNLEAEIRHVTRQQMLSPYTPSDLAPRQYVSPPAPRPETSSALRLQYQQQPAARPISAPVLSVPPPAPVRAMPIPAPLPERAPTIPTSQGSTRMHAGAMVVEGFVNSDTDVHVSAVSETPVVIKNCSALSGTPPTRIFLHGPCRGVLIQGCKNLAVCADQIHESLLIEHSTNVYLGTGAQLPPSTQVKDAPQTTIFAPKETFTTTLQLSRSAPATLLLAPSQRNRAFTPEQILSGRNCYEVPLSEDGIQRLQNGQMVGVTPGRPAPGVGSSGSVATGLDDSGPLVQGSHKPVKLEIVLDEDYDQVVGDRDMQNLFRDQFLRELASSCHAHPRRFDIKSVSRGSIVMEVMVLSDANDNRTPIQLAAQLVAMARDPGSHLRSQRTFKRLQRMDCADLNSAGIQGISNLSPKQGKAGIGIMMDVTNAEGIPIILEVNKGGPADMSGNVRPGDRVVEIDGKSTHGMSREQLVESVSGLPGSVVRLRLRESTGQEKSVTLTRRVTPVNQKLADAASMIADSFKSPAYKTRKNSADVTNFQDTYTKKAMPAQVLALSPALEETTFSANTTNNSTALSPAFATLEDQNRSQSLAAPQHLSVNQPPVQSVMMQEQQDQWQSPRTDTPQSLSQRQAIAETNLRAELARAQRQAETQQMHALRASQGRGAADMQAQPPAPAATQPRLLSASSTPQPPQPPQMRSPPPPQQQPAPPPPPQQQQQRQVQHKYSAITPARPPAPGAPRVTATVVSASNLPVTERFGLCNPYVIMAIGSAFHKTTVKQSTLSPHWDETYEFPVQPALLQGMLLTLTVEDHSAALRDEPIGQLSIPLLQLMVRKEWSGAFDLRTMKSASPADASPTAVMLKLRFDPGVEG